MIIIVPDRTCICHQSSRTARPTLHARVNPYCKINTGSNKIVECRHSWTVDGGTPSTGHAFA